MTERANTGESTNGGQGHAANNSTSAAMYFEPAKELLLAFKPRAMMDWLAFDPLPKDARWYTRWSKRAIWTLGLPAMLVKLIGGSITYLLGAGFEHTLKQAKESEGLALRGFFRFLAGITGLLYLPLRALFLPMASMRDAMLYRNPTRIVLMIVSGLLTAAGWIFLAIFALPTLLSGLVGGAGLIGLNLSSIVTSTVGFFTGLGAAIVPTASTAIATQIGSGLMAVSGALLMGIWRGIKAGIFKWKFASSTGRGNALIREIPNTDPDFVYKHFLAGMGYDQLATLASQINTLIPKVPNIDPDFLYKCSLAGMGYDELATVASKKNDLINSLVGQLTKLATAIHDASEEKTPVGADKLSTILVGLVGLLELKEIIELSYLSNKLDEAVIKGKEKEYTVISFLGATRSHLEAIQKNTSDTSTPTEEDKTIIDALKENFLGDIRQWLENSTTSKNFPSLNTQGTSPVPKTNSSKTTSSTPSSPSTTSLLRGRAESASFNGVAKKLGAAGTFAHCRQKTNSQESEKPVIPKRRHSI